MELTIEEILAKEDEIDYKNCRAIEELKIFINDYMDYYNNDCCQ